MRLARALLFLALSGAVAHADDARPADAPAAKPADAAAKPTEAHAKVPLRVVRMLPDTHQALLFDRTKGTHVVVEAGQAVEGFLVDAIDDDEVTLLSDNGATFVLAGPEPAWRHHRADGHPTEGGTGGTDGEWREPRMAAAPAGASPAGAAPRSAEAQPADPYADAAAPDAIGTGADGVRVVEAPSTAMGAAPTAVPTTIGTGIDGVRVVESPDAPPRTAPAPAAVTAAVPAPAPAPAASKPADSTGDALAAALTGAPAAPAPATPALATSAPATSAPATPAADATAILPRADVTAALSNFGTLATAIHGAFTPTGVRIDSAAGLFARAGLRAGDTIASVDNVPLRSLDDAANLYARAASARNVSIAIVRAGKPMTLRVAIQ